MGAINGRVIYSPKGKAGEYAENAANFFVGCSNGCTYCYLRKGRGAKVLGGSRPELKKTLREYPYALDIFKNELLAHKEELQKTGLFFSFTTDPLLPETERLTRQAVGVCQRHGFRTFASVEPIPPGMYDRAIGIIKLSYPFVDLYKIGLQSGGKYPKREIRLIYDTITEHWEGRPEQPRIYWKDSIVNPLGIDRGELPGYCVPVNWNLFNNEK